MTDATSSDGFDAVMSNIGPDAIGTEGNPPPFAPPILRHGDLLINQTPNILLYLGRRHGLDGCGSKKESQNPSDESDQDSENAFYHVHALALTALDGLSDEVHNTHHAISVELSYEEQKDASKRCAQDYVSVRLPKFLGYFEKVIKSPASGDGPWLYGGALTYADLVLFQVSSNRTGCRTNRKITDSPILHSASTD